MKIGRGLQLDRMAIEEAGPDPRRLAAAIHEQLPNLSGPVPVHDIAYALDIIEIKIVPAKSLEAALITTDERDKGIILVNGTSPPRRHRFSIGHELGHFLNLTHRSISSAVRFVCTARDLTASGLNYTEPETLVARHVQQEVEANRFAIELLAPAHLVRPYVGGRPNLDAVVSLSDALDISREASARRYLQLHSQPAAVVFTKDDIVRYVERGTYFPQIALRPRQRLGGISLPDGSSGLFDSLEVDLPNWLVRLSPMRPTVESLSQRDGFAMTLLTLGITNPVT